MSSTTSCGVGTKMTSGYCVAGCFCAWARSGAGAAKLHAAASAIRIFMRKLCPRAHCGETPPANRFEVTAASSSRCSSVAWPRGPSVSAASMSSVPCSATRAHIINAMAAAMAATARIATTGCSSLDGRWDSSCSQATMNVRQHAHGWFVARRRRPVLIPRDGHALDQDGAARAAVARHHVAADGRDRAEHLPQVAGDGDLLHREADLAVLDPVAGRAAGVVPGDDVDALPHELGDEQALAHVPQHAGEVRPLRAHEQVVMAARVAGALHAELARGVGAEEVALDHS